MRLTSRARASPTAIMAVVLAEGARPSGQASSMAPRVMQRLAERPRELLSRSVMAMQVGVELPKGGQETENLLGLAALGEGEDDVACADAAQVAVDGFGRVQGEGARAGGGEGGGQLLADQAGLAHAGDDDAAPALEDEAGGGGDGEVELFADAVEGVGLDAQNFPGEGEAFTFRLHGERRIGDCGHRVPPCTATGRRRSGDVRHRHAQPRDARRRPERLRASVGTIAHRRISVNAA